jgi:hypothetical protein
MDDEILTGASALVGVMDAGVDERLLHAISIDGDGRLVGVLFDDREQVAQESPLGGGQLSALDLRVAVVFSDLIDREAGSDERRRTG